MPTDPEQFADALTSEAPSFRLTLSREQVQAMTDYYALLKDWNPRLHLVAPCPAREFATRHVLESLLLLNHLPARARIADLGSGGGLPIVPCLVVRPDLHVTLIESSVKKSVFLRQVLRLLDRLEQNTVIAAPFQDVPAPDVDFVTCRALDKFADGLKRIAAWAPENSAFLFFVGESLRKRMENSFRDVSATQIPGSRQRFLVRASGGLEQQLRT